MAFFIYKHFFKKKLKLLFMISFHSTCFANVRVLRIYPAYEPYHSSTQQINVKIVMLYIDRKSSGLETPCSLSHNPKCRKRNIFLSPDNDAVIKVSLPHCPG